MANLEDKLNPAKGLIFRIAHISNVDWILKNGLHCRSSSKHDPEYVGIGNPDLIEKRHSRKVPVAPFGVLSDYVPFYFTPFSPMLYNITTGYGDIRQRSNDEIVFFVSSLDQLDSQGLTYVFTDRHASLAATRFYSDRKDLAQIDFGLLQRRDFQRDPEDPGKLERYQAEALVFDSMPVAALLGMACYTESTKRQIEDLTEKHDVDVRLFVRRGWYFQ